MKLSDKCINYNNINKNEKKNQSVVETDFERNYSTEKFTVNSSERI